VGAAPNTEVVTYAAGPNGARAVAFDAEDGIRVLVEPATEENNPRAVALAAALSDATRALGAAAGAITVAERDAAGFREQLTKARSEIRKLESINAAAVAGKRRFFGPVLMKPAKPGDWKGEVWLLDPVKQERGQTLCFASVAEVHALHPELWVVSAGADGVLLDAWGEKEGR
jgi:hypothetical protein